MPEKGWIALWLLLLSVPILFVCIKHIVIDWHEETWLRKSMFREILPYLLGSILVLIIAVILLIV